ncbi:hypothetical protein CKM354_000939400 [Cercospora kikuchii]|uniref:Non-reducing polyketide synthase CTB1 n=1 Tax=Cercospora kikuchii TaxID=84275 RepID=A0A9P3FJ50_9PEZI|nr:uncharacterized protein CKM354_000939400 [Cercospora kikuchii]GIZ46262.1 hypothetical protein CKM354_000939400 [Cercospora kikuchii]
MAQATRLYLFGDQTYDFVPKLKELLSYHESPILTAFLDQAHYVIRAESIESLPVAVHKASRTANLAELVQKYTEGKLGPAFQTALACTSQLGAFIRDVEQEVYPQANDSYVLGVCTGSLAAAAVASSTSLSQLLPLAVQTVLVAFRLGLCATHMRDLLLSSSDPEVIAQSWSTVLPKIDPARATEAIDEFCSGKDLPSGGRPWIASYATKSTTISGSPLILRELLRTPALANAKSMSLPICVPAHNSALFNAEHIRMILATTPAVSWSGHSSTIPFLSSVTGKLAWASNYYALLELALTQCLVAPIRWDKVECDLPQFLSSAVLDKVVIKPMNTTAQKALANALSAHVEVAADGSTKAAEAFSHRSGSAKGKLAIVSMSGRFPEAQSTEAFWELLYQGLDVVKEVPRRRWNIETHVDPTGKARNKGATKWGCWLNFAGQFDPKFFSISPKEAPQMDPAQRMALMSTYEAMERGGIVPDTTSSTQRNRVGVFHGVTSNDWMETNTAQNIDTYFITGGNRGFIPGRINFCFEFSGPSFTNDTACSSSLAAIHLACNSLWRGDCDTAVAGGTNMIFTPDGHAGLDKGFFLSRTGNCKPFDDAADGYCRAEGVGTVFIKRLEDALADKDPILGVILDTKTNHSAMSESMTRPLASAQIDNMSACLAAANVDPDTVGYVEMHGTGTQVGDAEEMKSVLACFAPNEALRSRDVYIGSAKANVGHGEGVSGVTSLIKVLLMMQNNMIPPHCGIKPGSKINHNYPDLPARKVHIAFEPKPWPRSSVPRRALINNFSAAGGNTALLIEDAPTRSTEKPHTEDTRSQHIVTVSAHVAKSLKGNLEALLGFLQRKPEASLSELSYTMTARRWHHLHRVSVTGASIGEIETKLAKCIENGDGMHRPKAKPSIAFAYTGQGSQYIGMGKQLYEAYPTFRSELQRLDQLAQSYGFPSFLHVYTSTEAEGEIDDLIPVVVQLAIACLQIALGNLLASFGIRPTSVIGHSLGEYAALHMAGVLSAADTIYLVGRRAQLLQDKCQRHSHCMLATKASVQTLEKVLAGTQYEISCWNGPEDTVLSGSSAEMNDARRLLSAQNIKSTVLKLPFAFHSAQVEAILPEFEKLAQTVTFNKPMMPVLSTLLGKAVNESGVFGPSYLSRHCRKPVDAVGALQDAAGGSLVNERTVFIEVGPKPLLSGMIKMTLGSKQVALPTLKPKSDVWVNMQSIFSTLYNGGLDLNWSAYHAPFDGSKRVMSELPTYSWDLKDYYIEYEGDWCLHRHKIHCNCAEGHGQWQTSKYEPGKHSFEGNVVVPGGVVKAPSKPSKLDATKEAYPEIPLTTTLHRVVEEKTEPLGATFVVETDMSRPDVNNIAQGHLVDGIPLATPSFYADIAAQAGKYCMDRIRAGHQGAIDGLIDVCDLVVDKALIPHGKAPQLLRTTLTMTWPPKAAATTRSAKVKFATYFADGKLDTEHATCTVRFTTTAQLKTQQKLIPEYRKAIESLRSRMLRGELVRYNTKSGYKLMSSMASFHSDYKLLQNLILNEADNEAISVMNLAGCKDQGVYSSHPAFIDAFTQVAGFAMNAKDDTDIDQTVFVNHGWKSFQVYVPLDKTKPYEVYTKMVPDKTGDLVHGDLVVLDGETIVAFFSGLSLRSVPRKALRAVLQAQSDKAARQRGEKVSTAQSTAPRPAAFAPTKVQKAAPTTQKIAAIAPQKPEKPASLSKPQAETKPASAKTTPSNSSSGRFSSTVQAALQIISEESGIALQELTDDSEFTDIGVDSLSSMVIAGRLREDLDLDLDPDFALFATCPTVGSLRTFIGGMVPEALSIVLATPEEPSQIPSPAPELEVVKIEVAAAQVVNAPPAHAKPVSSPVSTNNSELVAAAIRIVAEESGMALDDLTDDTVFTEVGIDSLSSLVISSRLREELEVDLDSDFSLFTELPTVQKLKEFFGGSCGQIAAQTSTGPTEGFDLCATESDSESCDTPSTSSSPCGSVSGSRGDDVISVTSNDASGTEEPEAPALKLEPYCRATNSVILQGLPKVAQKTLFMLPDGGGSASSYLTIPRLKADVAIVGLNCPYARDPENMRCTHQAMIQSFVNEIKRRQPQGPYHLGGWSSGGAFAYVTAEALAKGGDEVHSLIIIDAPVPQVMEKLPVEFYQHCNTVGMFANQPGGTSDGSSEPPPYLIPHFVAVVDVMLDYVVAPLPTARMPKVGIIWAADTVMKEEEAPKMKGMHFMVQKRIDFGPDGWETVLPGAEFEIVRADGANHFTLMQKDHVHRVSQLIERVMS